MKAKPGKKRGQSQAEQLLEAAHMFKADHDEAAFENRLKKIVKGKPKKRMAKKKKR